MQTQVVDRQSELFSVHNLLEKYTLINKLCSGFSQDDLQKFHQEISSLEVYE